MKFQEKAAGMLDTSTTADTKNHTEIIRDPSTVGKLETTWIARFALRGHSVHRLADGGFLVCRHGMSRHCRDLRELIAFARIAGVQ